MEGGVCEILICVRLRHLFREHTVLQPSGIRQDRHMTLNVFRYLPHNHPR